MKLALPPLTRTHWLLFALFLATAAASGFFAGRFVENARHWSETPQEPIKGWMTLGYLAHAYEVPVADLHQALDLPPEPPDRRPLAEIAEERKLPLDALRLRLEHAIAMARGEVARPPPSNGASEAEP
ncbi:hypothetical protein [Aquibaculum arenosum]|uniref:Uncharacterized protein n=1 Tax=Aquibaculum arenosum TaxID=3032591 RepID=A0ABT5YI84_9PROT|nr:hypothetical protein [Fodinicurvata sp. CAU 1616]MDF2094613.1 hypothetical protein [Fodinicurvata sp. CAU 1616]